jgi:ABC-2 type transport system permease protein
LVKPFFTEQVQKQAEDTNRPAQFRLKPDFREVGAGLTNHTKKSQFVKPGFIDPRYKVQINEDAVLPTTPAPLVCGPFLNRDTQPQIRDSQPALVPVNALWSQTAPLGGADMVWAETAKPPYAHVHFTLATAAQQYLTLLRVLLAEYRTTWFPHTFSGLLIPMGFAFIAGAVGAAGSTEKAIYLVGGNMALSITSGPMSFLINKIGWGRQRKEFDYWIALPVSKLLLILALISVALVFALPGLMGVYVFTSLLFGLSFSGTWALIPLIPLAVLPVAGIGALVGVCARDGQVANVLSQIMLVFVSVLSPVLLPLESLPVPLRIISQFMPTTYVADAFRAMLGGYPGTNLALDILILALFAAVVLTITYFRLDWRSS